MNNLLKLTFFTSAIFLYGCNEQVSPELQNANSTSSTPTPTTTTDFYFKVENTSNPILNFNLHKTGAGNGAAACEVRGTTALSSDLYRAIPADNDISCFFEAEELSMAFAGLQFKNSASANTCEFIGYSPYSYFEYEPGTSTSTWEEIECTTAATTSAEAQAAITQDFLVGSLPKTGIGALPPNGLGGTANIGCGEMVDSGTFDSAGALDKTYSRSQPQVESDQSLCRFDYTLTGGPNCDPGLITITKYETTYTPDDPTTVANDPKWKATRTLRTHDCGGKITNCIAGPITQTTGGADLTRVTILSQSTVGSVVSNEIILTNLLGQGSSIEYANFRRDLASLDIDFQDSTLLLNPVTASTYADRFADPLTEKTYSPTLMDMYSNNKLVNNQPMVTTTARNINTVRNGYRAKSLASDPFVGLDGFKTNPFYTFYCLDRAYDIKARIRMVVRDWDRVFPSASTSLEVISDIALAATGDAKQDVNGMVEIIGDYDEINGMNDKTDWDDFIPMLRTGGVYNPLLPTTWAPFNGQFKAASFPGGGFD